MQAHFYILAESFLNNSNYTNLQIEEKVKRLAEDVVRNKHKRNHK